MIYHKIFITEQKIKNELEKNHEKLAAIERIKKILGRVDERVEFVSVTTAMELEILLSELKGDNLNDIEREMVVEIITNEN